MHNGFMYNKKHLASVLIVLDYLVLKLINYTDAFYAVHHAGHHLLIDVRKQPIE